MASLRPVSIAVLLAFAALPARAQMADVKTADVKTADVQASDTPAPSAPLDTMPRWAEFPGPPEAVPTPAEIRLRVNAQLAKRQELDTAVAALVWDKHEPDAIAAEARGHLDPAYLQPVDAPMTPQQIDAFAASLRAKATPPPVAQ
ncbi:hypothetical protein [Asticcacaulis solisilvae]|uniref:hypothetical protein n=1 Tax=Asticcacaulis solisilvae TaxID=1217274 RepID=UPI003FD8A3F4